MIVAELSPDALRARLRHQGLRLQLGPVVGAIRSTLPEVARGIALHYAAHELAPDDGFADFHVGVFPPRGLRRWIRPQVDFHFDHDIPFAPLPRGQGFAMLEWGLNWCISAHCHQRLIIHAAVVARGDQALVMPAPSGSGKSTLCAALVQRGWRLLSDELLLLDPATGLAAAMARPVSLKNASIDVIRRFAPQAVLGEIVEETTKGRLTYMQPPTGSVRELARPARPRWIVVPAWERGTGMRWQALPKPHALMHLIENAFNFHLHGRQGFELLADLVDRCDCGVLAYEHLDDALARIEELTGGGIA